MAAIGLHAIALAAQAGVHEVAGGHGGGTAGAGGQHAGGRALAPTAAAGYHGELVGAGGRAVVEVVGGRVGLEGPALVLRGPGVGRREVGVVEAAGGRHAGHAEAADARARGRGTVGEGGRHGPWVMHPGVREAALREGLQPWEGAVELAGVGERVQVRGAWGTVRRTVSGSPTSPQWPPLETPSVEGVRCVMMEGGQAPSGERATRVHTRRVTKLYT